MKILLGFILCFLFVGIGFDVGAIRPENSGKKEQRYNKENLENQAHFVQIAHIPVIAIVFRDYRQRTENRTINNENKEATTIKPNLAYSGKEFESF